jgi:hypothetical protein
MATAMQPDYESMTDFRRRTGFSKSLVYAAAKDGRLPGVIRIGRSLRIPADAETALLVAAPRRAEPVRVLSDEEFDRVFGSAPSGARRRRRKAVA